MCIHTPNWLIFFSVYTHAHHTHHTHTTHTHHTHTHNTHTHHTHVGFCGLWGLSIGVMVLYWTNCVLLPYTYPTPKLSPHRRLCAFLDFKKTPFSMFLSLLNYGDIGSVLINHLHIVIPLSYPCYYTNLCPHKPLNRPHTPPHTHTHTHTHTINVNVWIKCFKVAKTWRTTKPNVLEAYKLENCNYYKIR